MKATQLYQKEVPTAPPSPYRWTDADSVDPVALWEYLCDLGVESEGAACVDCESQCSFGKRLLSLSPKEVGTPKQRIPRKRQNHIRPVRGFKNGVFIGEWPSPRMAADALGLKRADAIVRAIQTKGTSMGYSWEAVDDT